MQFLIIIYKPHIGICNDVHLSATFVCDPFVHFEDTQFPYPAKDALYKTEKSYFIFNWHLTYNEK